MIPSHPFDRLSGRAILGAEPNPASNRITLPQRLRLVLEELGPTYVKLGQVMSTRADLIPPEWVEEFKKLQNKVPGVEYDVIHKLLEEELERHLDCAKRRSQIVGESCDKALAKAGFRREPGHDTP